MPSKKNEKALFKEAKQNLEKRLKILSPEGRLAFLEKPVAVKGAAHLIQISKLKEVNSLPEGYLAALAQAKLNLELHKGKTQSPQAQQAKAASLEVTQPNEKEKAQFNEAKKELEERLKVLSPQGILDFLKKPVKVKGVEHSIQISKLIAAGSLPAGYSAALNQAEFNIELHKRKEQSPHAKDDKEALLRELTKPMEFKGAIISSDELLHKHGKLVTAALEDAPKEIVPSTQQVLTMLNTKPAANESAVVPALKGTPLANNVNTALPANPSPAPKNNENQLKQVREYLRALKNKQIEFNKEARITGEAQYKDAADAVGRVFSIINKKTGEYAQNKITLEAYKKAIALDVPAKDVEILVHPEMKKDVEILARHRGMKQLFWNIVICLSLPIVGWVIGLVSLIKQTAFFKFETNSISMFHKLEKAVSDIKEPQGHDEEIQEPTCPGYVGTP